MNVTLLNSLLPLPTFAPPSAPSASPNAGEVSALQSASAAEEENVTTVALSGKSSARYADLTAPLSLLALLGASGALVAAGKRMENFRFQMAE